MRVYAICKHIGGAPVLPEGGELKGHNVLGQAGQWSMQILGGTDDQIDALAGNPDYVVLSTYADVNEVMEAGVRAAVDAWTDQYAPSWPDVPAGWTNAAVIENIVQRVNPHFTLAGSTMKEVGLHATHQGIRCLLFSPPPAGLRLRFRGEAWKLYDLSEAVQLWEVLSDEDELRDLHHKLYETIEPLESFGILAVVNEYGTSFYPRKVMTATDQPVSEALARRNRIATYLESLGHDNTATLRAATTEHAQIQGIVQALGFNMNTLWNNMHGE